LMWHEEDLNNASVLQGIHISNLVLRYIRCIDREEHHMGHTISVVYFSRRGFTIYR
jgi:hypothetical protein